MLRRDLIGALAGAGGIPLLAGPARAALQELRFRDLYERAGKLSARTIELSGTPVGMTGYMAPPLKPEVRFFVLTRLPMSTCPFCESEAQWPDDIVVVYTRDVIEPVRYTDLVKVEGRLETGFLTDSDSGFVSLVRLTGASYQKR